MHIWKRFFSSKSSKESGSAASGTSRNQSSDPSRCAACGKTFVKSAGGLVFGDAEAMVERIKSRPTYCSACAKHFCLGCAFTASKQKGLNFSCCPDCGSEVPDDYPF